MAGNVETTKNCGNCQFFRTTYHSTGESLGMTMIKGEEVREGFCRATFGLKFGRLNEKTVCRQPSGVFKSKEVTKTVSS